MRSRCLVVIPVHDEKRYLKGVLDRVIESTNEDILAIDDGSTDGSSEILGGFKPEGQGYELLRHPKNRGYGYTLIRGFDCSIKKGYEFVLTLDGDGQHPPEFIPKFIEEIASRKVDIVSGSRYLPESDKVSDPPEDNLKINREVTERLNKLTDFNITDAFCGYKIYRCEALEKLELRTEGYGMPLELILKADKKNLSLTELAVPLIYKDSTGPFPGELSDPEKRLDYYYNIMEEITCSTC